MDNDIRTLPKQKLIQLKNILGQPVKVPYRSHKGTPLLKYQAYAVKADTVLYPGESMKIPVNPSMQCRAVNVTMRKPYLFSDPCIQNANDGYVMISNNSNQIASSLM